MPDAIVLSKLTKTFGDTVAVRDVDLVVPEGALCGVIGPNGAGKTTMIRMILAILFPDSGELRVLGRRSALEAKDRIGYLPEERGLYKKMRVGDFLVHIARLKGVEGKDLPRVVEQWLERVGLGGTGRKRCEELSKGMQQKVQFATALIHEPALVILDEPWSGLDPINAEVLRDVVDDIRKSGRTVIFSTHGMEQAEKVCDAVCIIARGKMVLEGKLREIKRAAALEGLIALEFATEAAKGSARTIIDDKALVAEERPPLAGDHADCEVKLADGVEPQRLLAAFVSAGVALRRFEIVTPTLHQIFVDKVGEEAAVAARLPEGG